MASSRACVRSVCSLVALALSLHCTAYGGDFTSYYSHRTRNLASQSYDRWQHASSAARNDHFNRRPVSVKYSGGTKAAAAAHKAALQEYLSDLVPEMKPSSTVAHIPEEHPVTVNAETPEKKWTKYYSKAKNSLRPYVEYEWKSNASRHREMITLSADHIETLKDNFDILMWYRNELDTKAADEKHQGAQSFKLFLDHFVGDLLQGLPSAPKINMMTGKVDGDEWELDEQNLREQLIMAYRYLIAKHQVYDEYEQFGPADRELMESMMKIAFLMGAHMHPDWFQETDVNLKLVSKRTQWKKPIVEALEVLQDEETDESNYEEPCVISIPPPKPKKASPRPKKSTENHKVEIIIQSTP